MSGSNGQIVQGVKIPLLPAGLVLANLDLFVLEDVSTNTTVKITLQQLIDRILASIGDGGSSSTGNRIVTGGTFTRNPALPDDPYAYILAPSQWVIDGNTYQLLESDDRAFIISPTAPNEIRIDRVVLLPSNTFDVVEGDPVETPGTAYPPTVDPDSIALQQTIIVYDSLSTPDGSAIPTAGKDGVTGIVYQFHDVFLDLANQVTLNGETREEWVDRYVERSVDFDGVTVSKYIDEDSGLAYIRIQMPPGGGGTVATYSEELEADGVQTTFTTAHALETIFLVFNGGIKLEEDQYSGSGTTLSLFDEVGDPYAPDAGSKITVLYTDGTTSSGPDSGGHVIQNEGVDMPQRSNLNFIGFTVEDDEPNDATNITAPEPSGSGPAIATTPQTRTGTNNTTAVSPLQLRTEFNTKAPMFRFNVLDYGAVGDGVYGYNGAMTSGSPTLTSSGAAFTTALIGMKVKVSGAGASGADLVADISGVPSSTTLTLSVNASTTVSGKFFAYGTDDTAAIQSAIDAVGNAKGGTVYFPNGVYVLAGALGGNNNSQLSLPTFSISNQNNLIGLTIEGESGPNFSAGGPGSTIGGVMPTGAVLHSFIQGSGTEPSILSGKDPAGGLYGYIDYVRVHIKNLTFRNQSNAFASSSTGPSMGGVNTSLASAITVDEIKIDVDAKGSELALPTNNAAIGLFLPQINTDGNVHLNSFLVFGYYTGVFAGEHTIINDGFIQMCRWGLVSGMASYPITVNALAIHWCKISIVACSGVVYPAHAGYSYIDYRLIRIEHFDNPAKWYYTAYDVSDGGNLQGKIGWHSVLSYSGPHDVFTFETTPGPLLKSQQLTDFRAFFHSKYASATAPTNRQISMYSSSAGVWEARDLDAAFFAVATGTNTYAATFSPAITTFVTGLKIYVAFTNANTGPATLNPNTLGAKTIVKNGSTAVATGDILANQILCLVYDGANFQIIGSNSSGGGGGGGITALTGDVAASGTGSVTATIQDDAVQLDDIQNIPNNTVLGNQAGSSASPQAMDTINIWDSGQVALMTTETGKTEHLNTSKYTQIGNVAVSGATEGSIFGTGIGDQTFPLDTIKPGKELLIKAYGYLSTTSGTDAVQIKVKNNAGSTVIFTGASTALGATLTTAYWDLEVRIFVRATGTTANAVISGAMRVINGTSLILLPIVSTALVNFDTTQDQTLNITLTGSAGGFSATCQGLTVSTQK